MSEINSVMGGPGTVKFSREIKFKGMKNKRKAKLRMAREAEIRKKMLAEQEKERKEWDDEWEG